MFTQEERSLIGKKLFDCAFYFGKSDFQKSDASRMIDIFQNAFKATAPQSLKAIELYMLDSKNKFFPSPANLREYFISDDGRPGPDEAWGLVPHDEYRSVVWNDEISEAYGRSRYLLDEGDRVGARLAFKEAYEKIVKQKRSLGLPPKWIPSLGMDHAGRETAIVEAVQKGRLALESAMKHLPEIEWEIKHPQLCLAAGMRPQLPPPPEQVEKVHQLVQKLVRPMP